MKKVFKILWFSTVYSFAAIGLFFISTFLLNRYGLTNTMGKIDAQNFLFKKINNTEKAPSVQGVKTENNQSLTDIESLSNKLSDLRLYKMKNFCRVININEYAGGTAENIINSYKQTKSDVLLSKMISVTETKFTENSEFNSNIQKCESLTTNDSIPDLLNDPLPPSNNLSAYIWDQDEISETLRAGILKDKDDIIKASNIVGIEPRMLVACMYAEQTRMFRTQRGLFKQYLAPLKILASANQFSLGVMGIKPKTAEDIEKHLKDTNSPYYLGPEYENLLNFSTSNPSKERYERLSHPTEHFYSYLYGAILLKQLEKQWSAAGYPIDYRPEIVSTLYNIGFDHSEPNGNAQAGGASLSINGAEYTYGSLSYEFYYSGNLNNEFPFDINK